MIEEPWRRTHPATALVTALRFGPRALPAAIPLLLRFKLWGVVIGAVALVAIRFVIWLTTTYRLGAAEIVIRKGVLNRSVRTVPATKVQSIESRRRVLHQALGLAVVEISMAGSAQDRIELDAVTEAEAERIRARLHSSVASSVAGSDVDTPVPLPPPERVVLRLSPKVLTIGALTGAGLLAVPFVLLGLMNTFEDIGPVTDRLGFLKRIGWVVGVAAVVLAAPTVAVAVALLRNFGWTMTESGGQLRVKRGLTEARVSVIPLARVARIIRSQNPVRRKIGYAALDVRTAAAVKANPNEGVGSADDSVPAALVEDIDSLERLLMPGATEAPLLPHPKRVIRRLALGRLPFLLVPCVVAFWFLPVVAAVGLVLLAFAVGFGSAGPSYRRMRYGSGPGVAVVERGWFISRREIAALAKAQSIQITQSPLQRRAGLATLSLQLPIGNTDINDIAYDEAVRLARLVRGVRL